MQISAFFDKTFTEAHCIMIEIMSSNKTKLQLQLVLINKDKKARNQFKINSVELIKMNSG